MLPRGFLGTRADVLMDVVIVSLAVILPMLLMSLRMARRRRWEAHRTTQVALASGLGVVVLLFETDLRLSGGIFELTKDSSLTGTLVLNASIYVHTLLAISTTIVWIALIALSLRRFGRPPKPNPFSRSHRRWGRVGMIAMALTAITGLELYVVGFAR